MVVAVFAVGMMQVAVDPVVNVVPMRNRFMAATRPMRMGVRVAAAGVVGSAASRVVRADVDRVLVYMILMGMMKMPVVQVIDVVTVPDRRVAAVDSVLVTVIGVRFAAHDKAPFLAI